MTSNQSLDRELKKLKKLVTNKRRFLKAEYFAKKWNQAGQNPKKQWRVVNSLVCPGSPNIDVNFTEFKNKAYTEPDEIVNVFARYFSDLGGQIYDSVKQEK